MASETRTAGRLLPDDLGAVADELSGCHPVTLEICDDDIVALAEHDATLRQATHSTNERMCARKKAYGRRAAHRGARKLQENQGEYVRAYHCPHCTRWHVGHEPVATYYENDADAQC